MELAVQHALKTLMSISRWMCVAWLGGLPGHGWLHVPLSVMCALCVYMYYVTVTYTTSKQAKEAKDNQLLDKTVDEYDETLEWCVFVFMCMCVVCVHACMYTYLVPTYLICP